MTELPPTCKMWLRLMTHAALQAKHSPFSIERYNRFSKVEAFCERRYRAALNLERGYLGR
jgi:hypothetical protein